MLKNLYLIAGVLFLLELYVYQAFKTFSDNTLTKIIYWVITVSVYGFFLYEALLVNRADRDHHRIQLISSIFLIFLVPKLLIVLFLFIDDISRFFRFGFTYFAAAENYYPERRKFLTLLGVGAAGVFAAFIADGIIFGKYRHFARQLKVKIPNLPGSFKGYKIVQISDVHAGSFFHPEKLQGAIDLINAQKPDLVLFTGDMVNNFAEEFQPFIKLFSSIQAQDGKFSCLGNHDYGDYAAWKSAEAKAQNIPNLIRYQKEAGFNMLRNEHHIIEKNGEKLFILGVENWGEKPFPQYGDLDKASAGIPVDAPKILMSHDPTHFDRVVKKHPANVHLTLSGHTHGMQFGLDLKNIKWSPVQYRYKKWVDLYESEGKFLYVNRGFGVLAYPGRVGIKPEITVITLA